MMIRHDFIAMIKENIDNNRLQEVIENMKNLKKSSVTNIVNHRWKITRLCGSK